MKKARERTRLEEMGERPGFRATRGQLDFFEEAAVARGLSLSHWLRGLAIKDAEAALGHLCPKRQPALTSRRKR